VNVQLVKLWKASDPIVSLSLNSPLWFVQRSSVVGSIAELQQRGAARRDDGQVVPRSAACNYCHHRSAGRSVGHQ
jgi:hypothetical protein